MGLLAWVVFPALAPRVGMHPGILLWVLMIVGLLWQVALSLLVFYRETGTLNLGTNRHRTWRQHPRDPKIGQPRRILWLWLILLILIAAAYQMLLAPVVEGAWTTALPFFAEPPSRNLERLLDTPERWVGAWYLLVLWALQMVGNYLWGEEFLFRSVLLPKMSGVFGKWDWAMNAVLFSAYHLHLPWAILLNILISAAYSWPSKRFRSNWFGAIVHGVGGMLTFSFWSCRGWRRHASPVRMAQPVGRRNPHPWRLPTAYLCDDGLVPSRYTRSKSGTSSPGRRTRA
jgi:membrane protease YdiL (CAAX protease family)